MKNYFDLTGQTAVVTGASTGLGVQMAKAFASQGANLVLIARRQNLLEENAANTLMEKLFPLADIITPNIPELEVISGRQIESTDDIIEASKAVYDKYGCPVLSKGGHFTDTACVCDYLWDGKRIITFETKRVDNPNSHGTGCTLSSAIASGLAKGQPLEQAVDNGKRYVTACLKAMLDLGHGSGPMNHGALILK